MFRRYFFGALAAVCFIAVFTAGVVVGTKWQGDSESPVSLTSFLSGDGKPSDLAQDVDFAEFWKVWRMVKERHVVQPVDEIKMFYGAISGMVASLNDPYSVYFDPEYAKKFNQELEGTFSGIGAEIGIKKDRLTIVAPLPGTPAEKAGLQPGDVVVGIDGVDTSGMPVDEAVNRIRGEEGTQVKLHIVRGNEKVAKEVVITRAKIKVDSVKWKMETQQGKKVAVITVSHFNGDTSVLFGQAVSDALDQGAKGLILDLRNNPGGYLESAVAMIGAWIPQGVAVTEKFSDGHTEQYEARGNGALAEMPTVVLVNGGSASASEIVAGALQDYGKAKIVGQTTYGKGSVQDYVPFEDTSALKITIALWLTPNGRSIDKQGIAPDFVVDRTEEDYKADRDPQIKKAFELLK